VPTGVKKIVPLPVRHRIAVAYESYAARHKSLRAMVIRTSNPQCAMPGVPADRGRASSTFVLSGFEYNCTDSKEGRGDATEDSRVSHQGNAIALVSYHAHGL